MGVKTSRVLTRVVKFGVEFSKGKSRTSNHAFVTANIRTSFEIYEYYMLCVVDFWWKKSNVVRLL